MVNEILDKRFEGATKVTAAEEREHEGSLFAKRTTDIPNNMQVRADYGARSDKQPVYLGYGIKGMASSASGWLLYEFTYDGSDRMTLRQVAYDTWDNRAGASYS